MSQYETFDFLINSLNAMDSDVDRWLFIKDNADSFVVKLDHNETTVVCDGDDRDDPAYAEMDCFLGACDGVMDLLNTFEMNAEFV